MKKLIALALVLLLLTGCTPAADTTDSTVADTTNTTAGSTPETTQPETTEPEATQPEATAPQYPSAPTCGGHDSDPYVDVDKEAFYANYTTACCYEDAQYRSQHYLMSGSLEVPAADVTFADNQPMEGTAYIRNTDCYYSADGNTYAVVDCNGNEVMRIYKGGAYITLEEVAAYMYAFGNTGTGNILPANYDANKKNKNAAASEWGQYLRVNHSKFKGGYASEPSLPNITGAGGTLQYYELDIGSTGYNNGTSITRGVCRLVYGRCDLNGDGEYGEDELFLFYTCNHYSDYREYLNYYGGWGELFGTQTGGGTPSPYVDVVYASFAELFKKAN